MNNLMYRLRWGKHLKEPNDEPFATPEFDGGRKLLRVSFAITPPIECIFSKEYVYLYVIRPLRLVIDLKIRRRLLKKWLSRNYTWIDSAKVQRTIGMIAKAVDAAPSVKESVDCGGKLVKVIMPVPVTKFEQWFVKLFGWMRKD